MCAALYSDSIKLPTMVGASLTLDMLKDRDRIMDKRRIKSRAKQILPINYHAANALPIPCRLVETAPFSHLKPKKKPRNPYRNR